MRLSDYLDPQLIMLDLPAASQGEAITRVVARLAESGRVDDAEEFRSDLNRRETQGSTTIGRGMAIPHARSRTLERIVVAMARLRDGVDFGAEDGEPVRLVFVIGAPEDKAGEYLKVLGRLSKLIKKKGLRKELLSAASAAEVLDKLEQVESQMS